jgi:hypothetical protein
MELSIWKRTNGIASKPRGWPEKLSPYQDQTLLRILSMNETPQASKPETIFIDRPGNRPFAA